MQMFYSPSLLKTPVKDPEQAIFKVDYETMALVNATGKNEVSIELKEPKQKSADYVTELRFFVQNNEAETIVTEDEGQTPARAFVNKLT